MDLSYFKHINLYHALCWFFDEINIPINYLTETPAAPHEILTNTYNPDNPAHRLMQEVYVVGGVDDGVFTQQISTLNTEQIKAQGYEGMLIFGVTLERSGSLPTRSQMAEITRAFNREFHYTPVITVFSYDHYLSFASCERLPYKQTWREGKKTGKVSILKDVDPLRPHTGHLKILENLNIQRTGKQAITSFAALYAYWQEVFSVSLLNKRFFRELANWYFWAVQQVEFPDDDGQERDIRNATSVIRLLTRLMFVWFLKEKHLIPDTLFDKTLLDEHLKYDDSTGSTYYKGILQNLFFATLHTEMQKDNPDSRKFINRRFGIQAFYRYSRFFHEPEKALELFKEIPFLNGGLFENLDKNVGTPEEARIDCFSDRRDNESRLKVPDLLFFGGEDEIDLSAVYGDKKRKKETVRGLIPILNAYKFTIAENTPIEEEVALDPELLGKVFENLLASYNPETQTTARKQTGSFYTPREIVNYMVDESLLAYLTPALSEGKGERPHPQPLPEREGSTPPSFGGGSGGRSAGSVEARLRHLMSYSEEPHQFSNEEVHQLIQAINRCKILDPACGSGAFPMGVLHKLVHLLHKLDPENARWKQQQIETQTASIKEDIAYAEQIRDDKARHKALDELHDKLASIDEAFDENEPDYSRKLYLIENCIYGVDIQPVAVQIAKLRFFISLIVEQKVNPQKPNLGIRPLPNLETKFVAANTLIGIEKPAQMMLRNPEIDKKKEELKNVRQRHFEARTSKTKEKYRKEDQRLRQELAGLLKKDGFPTDITEQLAQWNPYDQNASAGFFDPEWMFGVRNGFDVVLGNPPYVRSREFFTQEEKALFSELYPLVSYQLNLYKLFFLKSLSLTNSSGILSFITPSEYLSNDYDLNIRKAFLGKFTIRNILPFYKNVFDSAKVSTAVILIENSLPSDNHEIRFLDEDDFFNHNSSSIRLLKQKTFSKQALNYVINPFIDISKTNILEKMMANSVVLDNFFLVKNGIKVRKELLHKEKLQSNFVPFLKGQNIFSNYFKFTGIFMDYDLDKENLFTNQAFRSRDLFETQKIIVRQILGEKIYAAFDKDHYYTDQTTYLLLKKQDVNLKFVTAQLTSKLIIFYFKNTLSDNKTLFPKIKGSQLKLLPLRVISKMSQDRFAGIIDQILAAKQQNPAADTSDLERRIDLMVYTLYDLTYDEVKIVDPDFGLSAEEYRQFEN